MTRCRESVAPHQSLSCLRMGLQPELEDYPRRTATVLFEVGEHGFHEVVASRSGP
jgi:hypothetical protein